MSETDTETEETEPEAQPESDDQPDEEEEKPPIEEDEQADVALDDIDPEEIEEETSPDTDDGDDEDAGSEPVPTTSGQSWGDMYVSGLVGVSNAVRDEFGDGGQVDESLAYQIKLDEHFDRYLNEKGMGEDMPPGQAVMVGSAMFLLVSLGTDSELIGAAFEEVSL